MRSRGFAVAAACLLAATPCAASDFDWHHPDDQKRLIAAFDNISNMCAELGFTRQPKLPADAMHKKLEAHLLLATSADYMLERWAGILHAFNELDAMKDDKGLADRGADALIAASKDPDSYAKAEALYIETVMGPVREAKAGCDKIAADEFLGKFFLTGTGSVERFTAEAKKNFADSVADVSDYSGKVARDVAKKK